MELNTRGRYAVMAMAEIARSEGEGWQPLATVAERQHISLAYLEQIFLALRRAELVESARGRSGGYRLGRPADQISIADIMRAVEERTQMTRCMEDDSSVGCMGPDKCLTHNLWFALSTQIRAFLQSVTLADVISGGTLLHMVTAPDARGLAPQARGKTA